MHNEFAENMSKLYQSITKPMVELAELNINTMTKLVKNNSSLDELTQAKKPEEFLAAQAKLLNTANIETLKYAQQACAIYMEAATQTGKIFTDTLREATNKTSEFVRSNLKKEKEKDKGQQ